MSDWREEVLTADEMRAAEDAHSGPTLELMERAGRACAEAGVAAFPSARRWAVHCGGGANGGDGFVAARHLLRQGRDVELVLHADPARLRGDTAENYRRCAELGVPVGAGDTQTDALVDAVLGTGFRGRLRPNAAAAIAAINERVAPTVSVDVPSGVCASSGEVAEQAVQADLTVSFHRLKVAHLVSPAVSCSGRVVVADIGLQPASTNVATHDADPPSACGRVSAAIIRELPVRGRGDSKYSAGSVVVVGGSRGLTGAPVLSALAALRSGAGVAVICAPASLNAIFESRTLEVMTRPCADVDGALTGDAHAEIIEASSRAGAVALGPGLGRSEQTAELVRALLTELTVPVVLDADGLWAFNGRLDELAARTAPTVLTPHAGELGRLLGRSSAEVEARRLASVREAAERTGAVVVLKGSDTLIVDGAQAKGDTLISDLGTPGLATAGSGDVLTGVVAAALAKGTPARCAAALGAALTGAAAEAAAVRVGMPGLIASDVAHAIPSVIAAAHATGAAAR